PYQKFIPQAEAQRREESRLRCEMRDMAQATHTLAPPGGVDCDGDGVPDLLPGAPMVCRVQSNTSSDVIEMEGPLTRLLSSFVYREPVDLVGDGVDDTPLGDYTSPGPGAGGPGPDGAGPSPSARVGPRGGAGVRAERGPRQRP